MDIIVDRVRKELSQKYGHMMVQWYEAVDWQEPLILGLISFHVLLFMAILVLRHVYIVQVVLFLFICGTIFLSERLNSLGRVYWQSFASQNYFDVNGVFMGIFVAGPLLAIGFVQLASNLYNMAHMVVAIKRHELKTSQHKKPAKKDN
ncbi:hypothetical protein H310_00979 [Aphanomyces invadans]|uniref:Uncharacterized protein n=1 Tax=Aphanomyces invadans TaxID=157072 RepID=A0A024UQB8_9STRA|nr:hypothetical protein H310_00979 [Aphanomyces invadans]ETW08385.1 hypothetical protein H310_00979 [Aphanomyces invadans]RHY34244.1 hypothetical protein DYB32_001074 [Aphanomyces invadans]|eukprot:XP_008862190.1 hypothetical protein H310_00979 [Aphanomyces invadans]